MFTEEDLIKEYLKHNKRINKEEVGDLIDVVAKYLKTKTEDSETIAIELPLIGLLYKKVEELSLAKKSKAGMRRYLKNIYESDTPYKNFYNKETVIEKTYNVKTKTELQEALNNPSFKI